MKLIFIRHDYAGASSISNVPVTENQQARHLLLPASLLLSGCLTVSNAHAVLTDNLTIGNAKALALGHAVTADPPGIDSIHYNPAGLSRLKGRQTEVKLVSGAFDVTLDFSREYTPSWSQHIEEAAQGAPEDFTNDEAKGAESKTAGAAAMLPIAGMTKLPVLVSALGGISYAPPSSKLTFGSNVYAPLMVGFYRNENDPGRFVGKEISFTLLTYFSPSVAYQMSDNFSFGATVTFNYAGVGLELPFREPNLGIQWLEKVRQESCHDTRASSDTGLSFGDLIPCVENDKSIRLYEPLAYHRFEVENPLTFGVNVGFLWQAQPWLSVGAVYQSPVKMDMKGDFVWHQGESFLKFLKAFDANSPVPFKYLGPLASLVEPKTVGKASIDLTMPDHFAMGTSIQLTPQLKLNTDLKFTRWSEWQALSVHYSNPLAVLVVAGLIQPDSAPMPLGQTLVLPLGFKDTWNTAMGLEYQWSDSLALRLGMEDRPSSIPKEYRSPVLPIGASTLYAVGAEYKPSPSQAFNIALATLKSSIDMPGNTTKVGNSENPMDLIYNPYSGTGIKADLNVVLIEGSYRYQW